MDNYETGIYTDNPDDTLRYMKTTQPVDLWGYPKQETDLVEVVRCKDCKYSDLFKDDETETTMPMKCLGIRYGGVYPDWYCEHGERRSK